MRALPILVLLTGCFGSGPVPLGPSTATVVMQLPVTTACNSAQYIDDVALGPDLGIAIATPYQGNDSGNCGGQQPDRPVDVYGFNISLGRDHSKIVGQAGMSHGDKHPHACAAEYWAYADPSNNQNLLVNDGTSAMLQLANPMGTVDPAGFASDATAAYLEGWVANGGGDSGIANPDFPPCDNCGGTQTTSGASFTQFVFNGGTSQLPITLPSGDEPACEEVEDCLVDAGGMLWFVTRNLGEGAGRVWSFPAASTGTLAHLPAISLAGNRTFTGLAADATHVVWSLGPDFTQVHASENDCEIYANDLATGTTTMLLQTSKFSCAGIALDPATEDVYFAAVHVLVTDTGNNGNNYALHGDAVGRVSIADQTVETLALGFAGKATGPRRVLVDGSDLYLVDPLAVGRMPLTELDGKLDLPP